MGATKTNRITKARWQQYQKIREEGGSRNEACRVTGISYKAAMRYDAGYPGSTGIEVKREADARRTESPLPMVKLSREAQRGLEEFGYFRMRYFGRRSTPWQEEAGHRLFDLLDSPQREYVVLNCPPGSGKSLLFVHDIPAWLTAKRRSIRGMIGSATQRQADLYLRNLKRTFSRKPGEAVRANVDELAKGRAFDAEATLQEDYGRFRPKAPELWGASQLIVEQHEMVALHEKEPTWAAFGTDSGYLGWRVEFAIWDDLVTKQSVRNAERADELADKWEDLAESRIEPDGVLILQGQRMAANDLYRHCLDMVAPEWDEWEGDPDAAPRKYVHICYPAHDESRCRDKETHQTSKPLYWPEGCLLDPVRLPWRELRMIQLNRAEKYAVLYQQEDIDPASVLVDPLWIAGGTAPDGAELPGCWDNDRAIGELPPDISGQLISIATVDPSPTKWWAIQWWVIHVPTEIRILMDLHRAQMSASEFLDWSEMTRDYTGIADAWQLRSADMGIPITRWIVEQNAAQRFMLQYDMIKRWQARRQVDVVPHNTGRNKSDPEFGVQSIASHYRWGRVRLPGGQKTRAHILPMVRELTSYPDGSTDDCVMAHWMLEWNLPELMNLGATQPALSVPSWLAESQYEMMAQAGLGA